VNASPQSSDKPCFVYVIWIWSSVEKVFAALQKPG